MRRGFGGLLPSPTTLPPRGGCWRWLWCWTGGREARRLRVRPETLSRITEFSEHKPDGSEAEEGEGVVVETFPILGEPATAVQPTDCSLDNPALWQDDKALGSIAAAYDLGYQIRHGERQTVVKHWPCIRGVGEQLLEKREPTEQRGKNHQSAISILHIGRCHQCVQQQSRCIDEEMALLAFDQLTGIEPRWIDAYPPFSALFTL
jgi:hypothetical protein